MDVAKAKPKGKAKAKPPSSPHEWVDRLIERAGEAPIRFDRIDGRLDDLTRRVTTLEYQINPTLERLVERIESILVLTRRVTALEETISVWFTQHDIPLPDGLAVAGTHGD